MKQFQVKVLVMTATTKNKKIAVSGNTLTVGETAEIKTVSKYRKTIASAPKITYVAKVLDMLQNKKVSVLTGTDSLYVEYENEAGNRMCGLIRDGHQEWTSYEESNDHPFPVISVSDFEVLVGDVLFNLMLKEKDELMSAIRFIAKNPGSIAREKITFFCDSYFYFAKDQTIEVEDSLVLDPIKASYRRGQLADSFLTKLYDLPKASAISAETVDYKGEEEVAAVVTPETFLEECKSGKFMIPYEWKDEQKEYQYDKKLLDTFVPTDTFVRIVKKINYRTSRIIKRMNEGADNVTALGQDYINLTLTGKPGTGKTAMVYAISAATGLPVYTTAGSHNTDEDEFEGKTKMVDGKPASVPTDALKCFENGGIFLIEEANLPQAAVIMGALGQAVEFPFILKKNGFETIRRHPLCIFVTTMNVGTVGAKAMSQPFANRFKQSYVLNDPDKDVFINILMSRTGESRKLCKWIYEAYNSVLKALDKDESMADVESIKLALSMRSCIGAIENYQEGEYIKDAVKDSIIGKIAEQDLEISEKCQKAVDGLPDYR